MASDYISVTLANTYFGAENHIKSAIWLKFTTPQRTGAIEQAIRLLGRSVSGGGIPSNWAVGIDALCGLPDGPYNQRNYHPDFAVYEQALYMLENSDAIANGELSGPKFIAEDTSEPGEEAPKPLICHEALRWLAYTPFSKFKIQRG